MRTLLPYVIYTGVTITFYCTWEQEANWLRWIMRSIIILGALFFEWIEIKQVSEDFELKDALGLWNLAAHTINIINVAVVILSLNGHSSMWTVCLPAISSFLMVY